MDDAQVPPDAGEAKSVAARRPALRLSDAADVAATRLDMFGDPSLRDSLAGASAADGDGAVPLVAAQAPAEPPQPAAAPDNGTEPTALDLPPSGMVERRLAGRVGSADADQDPPGASEHIPSDVAAEPLAGAPDAEQPFRTEPAAAAGTETGLGVIAIPGTADAAEDAPREGAPEEGNGAAGAAGPFGTSFMMPPGSLEREADMSTGAMNERPRFREELIKPIPSPIVSDAALPDAEPSVGAELPQDPPFTGSPAPISEEWVPEGSPGVPIFSGFSGAATYPDEGPPYGELAPIAAEPVPPPSLPLFDAAAKIAAEANATAEALANLKRMLGHTMPPLEPVETAYRHDHSSEHIIPADPRADGLRLRMQTMQGIQPESPSPFTARHEPAPFLPLPVPPQRASGRGVYLLGFLTGLALSLMAGGVLYLFIAHIGPG